MRSFQSRLWHKLDRYASCVSPDGEKLFHVCVLGVTSVVSYVAIATLGQFTHQ